MSGDDLQNAQTLRVQVPKEGSVKGSFKVPLRDLKGLL